MNILPQETISGRLGEAVGGLGGGLQRLADAKMQHLEQQYQRKQQLRQMFENQQIQQAQQQQYSNQLINGGYSPENASIIASQMINNPATAFHALQGLRSVDNNQNQQPESTLPSGLTNGQQAENIQPQVPNTGMSQGTSNLERIFSGNNGQVNPGELSKILGQASPADNQQKFVSTRMPIPQVGGEVPPAVGLTPRKTSNTVWDQQALKKSTPAGKKVDTKFSDKITKDYLNSEATIDAAREALGLIETGKTRSGIKGYAPLWGAGPETRELNKIYEDLALTLAASTGGVLSKAKLAAAKATKPSLDMPVEAQKYMLNRIIQKAEKEGIALGDIRDQLVEENNGEAPENLEAKVLKEWKSKSKINRSQPPQQTQPQDLQQQGQQQQEEGLFGGLARRAAGVGSRLASGAVTGVGDIAAAGLGAANYLSSGKTPTYSEVQSKLPVSAPTSEDAAKKISEWTNGYTDPKSSFDETLYNIANVVGSLFSPGKAAPTVAKLLGKAGILAGNATKATKVLLPFSGVNMSLGRALGMASAGEAGKEAAKLFDAGPVGQSLTSMAFTMAAGFPGPRKAFESQANASYKEAAKSFGSDKVNVGNLKRNLESLELKFRREAVPHKEELKEILDSVQNGLGQTRDNQFLVNELVSMKQGLNARYSWMTSPRISGDRSYLPKELRSPLGQIIDEIKKPIAKAGLDNPSAGKQFVVAEDITKGLAQSSKATKWIKETTKLHNYGHSLPAVLMRMATGASLKAPMEIAKLYDFMKAYPQARKYYWNVMKAATMENKAMFTKNLAELDKIAKLHESKKNEK